MASVADDTWQGDFVTCNRLDDRANCGSVHRRDGRSEVERGLKDNPDDLLIVGDHPVSTGGPVVNPAVQKGQDEIVLKGLDPQEAARLGQEFRGIVGQFD